MDFINISQHSGKGKGTAMTQKWVERYKNRGFHQKTKNQKNDPRPRQETETEAEKRKRRVVNRRWGDDSFGKGKIHV